MPANSQPLEHSDSTQKELPITNPGVLFPDTPIEPLLGEPLTPRQERALRYLERKRRRHERFSQQRAAAAANPAEPVTPPLIEALPSSRSTQQTQLEDDSLHLPALQDSPATLAPATVAPLSVQALRAERWRRQRLVRRFSRRHLRRARVKEQLLVHRLWLTIGSILMLVLVFFLSFTGISTYVGLTFYHTTVNQYTPRVMSLRDLLPHDNLKVYDSKGVLIGQLTDQGLHTAVKFNQISTDLINATVAAEDKNFWTNEGIDVARILRAALDDIQNGRVVEGGSTITQQLIKILILQNSDVTLERKLQEALLTQQLNTQYSKSDILEMYLNSIYYGHQAYGIDAAATVYFGLQDRPGKPASQQLDLAQSAMLAGIPSSPSLFDPLAPHNKAFDRFQTVLDLMLAQHYITRVQMNDAIKEAHSPHFFKPGTWIVNRAPHFMNFVLSELQDTLHLKRNQLSRSDLIVYTTLDGALQDKIQKIAQQHIAELRDAHNVHNAAEVLIDFHTGAIRSLLGSIDYNDKSIDGEFDVATQGYRQPGSSFKPYVYVTAFAQGASPGQAIADTPVTIYLQGADQPVFAPQNYDGLYHGHMTLRCALQNSLNIPAVKVLQHVGIDAAMKMAHDMGIQDYKGYAGYSLVLGGLGVRLIDHVSAFGTFANGGVHMPYYGVEKVIVAHNQQTAYVHRSNGQRVISPQLAYMMTDVLSDNRSRIPEFGDCNVLQLYSNSQQGCYYGNRGQVRPAAAKTGTTNDFRDNWTIGYTTDYVMGVWAGNDNNTPMYNVSGVQGAAPIWHDSMLVAEQGHAIRDFTYPGGLERDSVTYPDGVQTTDWFLPGTVPYFPPPTPTPVPPTPTPTPTGVATGTSSPQPNPPPPSTKLPTPLPRPYCPGDYTFAFPPPSSSAGAGGWW